MCLIEKSERVPPHKQLLLLHSWTLFQKYVKLIEANALMRVSKDTNFFFPQK